jgi:hypothetical protein
VYARSNDLGDSWLSDIVEVGSPYTYYAGSPNLQDYASTASLDEEHTRRLQPSISLNGAGWPAVAWHVDRSGGSGTDYAIYYSYGTTGTVSSVAWISPTVLSRGQATTLGSAQVGIGDVDGQECRDAAYMDEQTSWEVYYTSDAEYTQVFMPLVLRE